MSDLHYGLSEEHRRQEAEENNCDIDYAEPNELQLDLDSPEAYDQYLDQWDLCFRLGLVPMMAVVTESQSKSGNKHVAILLDKSLPVERRILLQALLGSDLKREALALARADSGISQPVCLFRPRQPITDEL